MDLKSENSDPGEELVIIQVMIAGEYFHNMLLDDGNRMNMLCEEALDRKLKYNPWIHVMEPHCFIRIGEKPQIYKG